MRVLMFVTDDGLSPEGTGPALFVNDHAASVLPPHPRSLTWRYFATIGPEDTLLGAEAGVIRDALAHGKTYISQRLVFAPVS